MTKELYIIIHATLGALAIVTPLLWVFIGMPLSLIIPKETYDRVAKYTLIIYPITLLLWAINRTCGIGIAWERFM